MRRATLLPEWMPGPRCAGARAGHVPVAGRGVRRAGHPRLLRSDRPPGFGLSRLSQGQPSAWSQSFSPSFLEPVPTT